MSGPQRFGEGDIIAISLLFSESGHQWDVEFAIRGADPRDAIPVSVEISFRGLTVVGTAYRRAVVHGREGLTTQFRMRVDRVNVPAMDGT